jgi:hypothetical protein
MSVQVRNARQRLSLLGGDTPTDIGTGEPSFQDVVRLLMAIHLAGDERTPGSYNTCLWMQRLSWMLLTSTVTLVAAW